MKNLYNYFIQCEVVTDKYIDEKFTSFFEEMMVGNLGFSGSASPAGPVSGFDPVMNTIPRNRKSKKKSGNNDGRNKQT
jgi:hypothetical protein